MALRMLLRSRQLCSRQIMLHENVVPVRFYAKQAAPKELTGEGMLKSIVTELKQKFDMSMDIIRKEKITIDPEDPAAVSQYSKVMKMIRDKAGLLSESQSIKQDIELQACHIPEARGYLLALKNIREKKGLVDELGIENMMMQALDKVENEIKKPLLRSDKKGVALLMAEFDKINQKLGIRREDLPKYEEELEQKISKAQLEELQKDALDAMETQMKKEEFKGEYMVPVKSLDIRNFV